MTLPNNVNLNSNKQGHVSLCKKLSTHAQRVTVLPNLKISSLVSLGHICDENCQILLDKKKLHVVKDSNLILQRHHNYIDGLWDTPLHNPNPLSSNIVQQPAYTVVYMTSINSIKRSNAKYEDVLTHHATKILTIFSKV